MKIFALVVLSILAGVILLVGSSYLDIYQGENEELSVNRQVPLV